MTDRPISQMVKTPGLQLVELGKDGKTTGNAARKPRVAVVIPVYNEQDNIERVIAEVEGLRRARIEWDVLPIAVNDGSKDRTEHVLEALSRRIRMRVVNLPINLGIGGAVQTGFRVAAAWDADVTLQLDGDGQHPADQIPSIVEPVLAGRADVVVGSRYLDGAGGIVSSRMRRAGTGFFSFLLRVLVGARITDTTSGFRAFSHEALDLLARYYPDDYPEVQAYVPLLQRGFRVMEVPVRMRPREGGESSITPVLALYYMIKVAFATMIDVIRVHPDRRERLSHPETGPETGNEGADGKSPRRKEGSSR